MAVEIKNIDNKVIRREIHDVEIDVPQRIEAIDYQIDALLDDITRMEKRILQYQEKIAELEAEKTELEKQPTAKGEK